MEAPVSASRKGDVMRKYLAYYRGNSHTVYAESSYAAQLEAAKHWKIKTGKTYEITVVLAAVADDAMKSM